MPIHPSAHPSACRFCSRPARPYRLGDKLTASYWPSVGHAEQYRARGLVPVALAATPGCAHRLRDGRLCGAPAARVCLGGQGILVPAVLCPIHRSEMRAGGFLVEVPDSISG